MKTCESERKKIIQGLFFSFNICVSDMGDLTSQNSWSRNQPHCPVDNPDSATALLEWVLCHRRHTENTQAIITIFTQQF